MNENEEKYGDSENEISAPMVQRLYTYVAANPIPLYSFILSGRTSL